jgi:hypothetical protein
MACGRSLSDRWLGLFAAVEVILLLMSALTFAGRMLT